MGLKQDPTNVLVVEDHEETRIILADYLAHKGYVPHLAADGAQALALATTLPIHVALLDIELPDVFGTDLAAPLKKLWPEVAVVFITAYDSGEFAARLMRAGALHYLVKPLALSKVGAVVAEARAIYQARANLTQREREIMALLVEGKSNQQIATQLDLTEQSVKNRLRGIFPKLGVSNRAQAVVRAIELKLARKG